MHLSTKWRPRIQVAAVSLALLVALVTLLTQLHAHYPLQKWLVWRYAQYWLFALTFSAVCLSGGFALFRAVGPRLVPMRELLLLSMATGVLLFFLGMFLGGILGLYGVVFGVAWPALLFLSGARPLYRYLRRAWPHLRGTWRRAARPSGWKVLATTLGVFGFALVYASIIAPESASFDSRWYHLALPEEYAAAGGIYRSPVGWFHTALPQLASLVYLWPYLFPWGTLFDRIELAAHLEFVLFLWTVFAIGPLTRYLAPRARVGAAWTAFFLFSGVFVYDSSLNFGADHIAAFWAVPIWLSLRRAWNKLDLRSSLTLGAMLAGAMNTKVQSLALLVVPCLAVALRGAFVSGRAAALALRKRGASTRSERLAWATLPLATALSLLTLTTPYWLKNLIWYRDPMYPALYRHVKPSPWNEDMDFFYLTLVERNFWRPVGTGWEKARQTLEAAITFAFEPHNWHWMHRDWPVFGFLFTLSWFVLPFVGAGKRLWAVFLAGHVGVMTWFLFSHQDRYLQMLVPWMVACVAAIIGLTWRLGWYARVPLLALLFVQSMWGFAAAFIQAPTRFETSLSLLSAIDLAASGYRQDFKNRVKLFPDVVEAGKSTPPDAKILLHRILMHAGIQRRTLPDDPNWQGLISYRRLPSQRAVYDLYRELGVTHVMWAAKGDTHREETLAGDLRFFGFVTHALGPEQKFGTYLLSPMLPEPPAEALDTVLVMVCSGYLPGLYELNDLTMLPVGPPAAHPPPRVPLDPGQPELVATLASQANYVVLQSSCKPGFSFPSEVAPDFALRGNRADEKLYVRRKPLLP